jgi:nicotinamide-nucleotide amidase
MSKTKVWTAETIAIGSELLLGGRMDTNSLFIADRLAACGVELRYKTIVGDDLSDIVAVLKTAARRARVVIITGGLGPTVDDLTREAVAQATGHRLGRRKAALDEMTARLAAWGRTPTKAQFRAAILSNPVGTAPGFALNWKGTFFAALPGVPREMEPMFRDGVSPHLQAWMSSQKAIHATPMIRLVLHTSGVPESVVDQKLTGLLPKGSAIQLGIYASPLEVMVSLTGPEKATEPVTIAQLCDDARLRLGDIVYGEADDTMESVVLQLLLPFVVGHALRPLLGEWAARQRKLLTYSDRLTILLSVYSAFSAAVVGGIWSKVPLVTLLILALVCAALLAATLLFTVYGARAAGLSEADGRAMLYAGSLKSLVSGVPMARVLFPSAQIGAIILPVMIYHQLQLMVCATIARRQGGKPAG